MTKKRGEISTFYRNNRSTVDMIELAKGNFEEFSPNELSQKSFFVMILMRILLVMSAVRYIKKDMGVL